MKRALDIKYGRDQLPNISPRRQTVASGIQTSIYDCRVHDARCSWQLSIVSLLRKGFAKQILLSIKLKTIGPAYGRSVNCTLLDMRQRALDMPLKATIFNTKVRPAAYEFA